MIVFRRALVRARARHTACSRHVSAVLSVVLSLVGCATASAQPSSVGTISTFAGTGTAGSGGDGGAATSAQLFEPSGVFLDPAGNLLIADFSNGLVRKVAADTGIITTIAGGGPCCILGDGGPATSTRLSGPAKVALDGAGNLYIVEFYSNRVRMVSAATGIITTVAGNGTAGFSGDGGPATAAQMNGSQGVAVDAAGNIYIADRYNDRVRKVTAATGIITTVAGSIRGFSGDGGPATAAFLNAPVSVAFDQSGNLYIADGHNSRIRKVDGATGIITTVVGSNLTVYSGEAGPATSAGLSFPVDVTLDASGNLYLADFYTERIHKVASATGIITTIAGSGFVGFSGDGGIGPAAAFHGADAVAVDASGTVYIADFFNHRIRRLTPPDVATWTMSTAGGSGTAGFSGDGAAATAAGMNAPRGVAVDLTGNVYVSDTLNGRIRKVSADTGLITTVAGGGVCCALGDGGVATAAYLSSPTGVAVDTDGNIYVADDGNARIRKITVATDIITTVAGSGTAGYSGDGGQATSAQLNHPTSVAVDTNGNLYIADTSNNRVRKVTAATGIITTLAGDGTAGFSGDGAAASAAQLRAPKGVAVDATGDVYIADTDNHRIRKVTAATGIIATAAGNGTGARGPEPIFATSASLFYPAGVSVDAAGNLYIADTSSHLIRRVDVGTGFLTTIAGNGEAGYGGDGGIAAAATINNPSGVAVDSNGNVYVADTNNHRIRKAVVPVATPTNLKLTRYGTHGIGLNWSNASGATSYNIKRGLTSGGETPFANVTTNSTLITGWLLNTRYFFTVSALNPPIESGNSNEASIVLSPAAARSDIDGDNTSDIIVYRPTGSRWYSRNSGSGYAIGAGNWVFQLGATGDIPLQGDFDGDGKLDPTVFRPATAQWIIRYSSLGYDPVQAGNYAWGGIGDTPITGDWDGDGKTDFGVYRSSTGFWYLRLSGQNYTARAGNWIYGWGAPGDVPKIGDFDGDGMTDIAVYRAGSWFIRYSSLGFDPSQYGYYGWGAGGDTPIVGDFDGDGRTDIGVYRAAAGGWYLRLSSENYTIGAGNWLFQWGAPGDEPKLGDFDGDGMIDITVYRPAAGVWFIRYSSLAWNPAQYGYYEWGAGGDLALPQN